MFTEIELPKGIEGDLTFAQFDELCSRFNCNLLGKCRNGVWKVETDDVINFFWLGANIYNRTETPLTISITQKIANSSWPALSPLKLNTRNQFCYKKNNTKNA